MIFLFIAVVEIDVELRDAGPLQRSQLGNVILRLTQDSKAIDNIVGDEVEIGIIALAMLGIVIAPAGAPAPSAVPLRSMQVRALSD